MLAKLLQLLLAEGAKCFISQFVPLTKESVFTKTCTAFCLEGQESFLLTSMSKLEAASRIFSEIHGESTPALIYEEVVELAFTFSLSLQNSTLPFQSPSTKWKTVTDRRRQLQGLLVFNHKEVPLTFKDSFIQNSQKVLTASDFNALKEYF